MNVVLYGISNCDTVKKARKWLENHGIEYAFHDFRKDGLDQASLNRWVEQLGWEVLLNRRSTTWRKLEDADKADLDPPRAMALMLREPTLIKRPVLVCDGQASVGCSEQDYQALIR
jgi:Spx/MgsR family transcriptional regulator